MSTAFRVKTEASRLKPAVHNLICLSSHQLKLVADGESAEAD
jgi:hypothetical protein